MQNTSFDEFEHQQIIESQNKKTIDVSKLSFTKRVRSFLTSIVATLILNFSTKLRWQFALVTYLLIVCPCGTYDAIKFIVKLFYK